MYDELIVGDIAGALGKYQVDGKLHRALEMVIAADVFVYMGDLVSMFSELRWNP